MEKLGGNSPKGILKPDTARDTSSERTAAAAAAADIDAFEPAPKKSVQFQEDTRFAPSKMGGEVRRKSKKSVEEQPVMPYIMDEKGVWKRYEVSSSTSRPSRKAAASEPEPLKKIDMEEIKLDAASRQAEVKAYTHSVDSLIERMKTLETKGLSSHQDVKVWHNRIALANRLEEKFPKGKVAAELHKKLSELMFMSSRLTLSLNVAQGEAHRLANLMINNTASAGKYFSDLSSTDASAVRLPFILDEAREFIKSSHLAPQQKQPYLDLIDDWEQMG